MFKSIRDLAVLAVAAVGSLLAIGYLTTPGKKDQSVAVCSCKDGDCNGCDCSGKVCDRDNCQCNAGGGSCPCGASCTCGVK